MRRPVITPRILDGIIAATNAALAGPIGVGGDFSDKDGEDMERANKWAYEMRRWLAGQKEKRHREGE